MQNLTQFFKTVPSINSLQSKSNNNLHFAKIKDLHKSIENFPPKEKKIIESLLKQIHTYEILPSLTKQDTDVIIQAYQKTHNYIESYNSMFSKFSVSSTPKDNFMSRSYNQIFSKTFQVMIVELTNNIKTATEEAKLRNHYLSDTRNTIDKNFGKSRKKTI